MGDPGGRASEGQSSISREELEWVPREIVEAPRPRLFRRLNGARAPEPAERAQEPTPEPAPPAEPAPVPPTRLPDIELPPIRAELARRFSDVERSVAQAARAVDRSAIEVRRLVERNGDRPDGQSGG
jgi:hypothetical protein